MSLRQKQLPDPRPDADELRAQIADIAVSWLKTPWHHEARLKGAGVDCAQFLLAVYSEAGLIASYKPEHYSADWFLHRDDPLFLAEIAKHCVQVPEGAIGDIAMFKFGRHPAHGAIVLGNNLVIHAYKPEGQVTISELIGSPLQERLAGFYSWKGFAQ